MLARVRPWLTYANVVATLALFVALGGSAYAVSRITSKDVKNRSLRGIDVRRNTLTGKEVRESTLGVVPSSLSAGNASTAAAASQAANADLLGGQGPGAFEKSSRIQFGRAPTVPADSASERTLLEWPKLGVRLTTVQSNGGCPGAQIGIKFINTKASGPFLRVYDPSLRGNLPPNSTFSLCGSTPNGWDGAVGDVTGPTLFFQCVGVEGETSCLGIRSEP